MVSDLFFYCVTVKTIYRELGLPVIKVVPEKRKNRLYLENWRPISLLNIDYKIATKTNIAVLKTHYTKVSML